MSMMKVCGL